MAFLERISLYQGCMVVERVSSVASFGILVTAMCIKILDPQGLIATLASYYYLYGIMAYNYVHCVLESWQNYTQIYTWKGWARSQVRSI